MTHTKPQASSNPVSAPSGAGLVQQQGWESDPRRHRLGCRMLHRAGKMKFVDLRLPKPYESVIDWMVRAGLSPTAQVACEGLLVATNMKKERDDLLAEISANPDLYKHCSI